MREIFNTCQTCGGAFFPGVSTDPLCTNCQRCRITELERFVADTCEGMDCLPECDSDGHAEDCPLAHPVVAWRNLRERIAELEAENEKLVDALLDTMEIDAKRIAELEAVVAKLPQTADGVPVVSGMYLWSPNRDEPSRVYGVGRMFSQVSHGGPCENPRFESVKTNDWYSTREAAEQAKGGE